MIEWLFSHREAMKELYIIITALNRAIEDLTVPPTRPSSPFKARGDLQKIIIGLSCEDGCELSPCFVEKLYDHYKTNPPSDQLILVKRQHTQPENKRIPKERLKWQHYPGSTLLFRQRTESDSLKQVKSLTTSREWFDLPQELSDAIEEAYNKDPLANEVKITGVVLDMESGHMTATQTKQTTYIRCTMVPKDYTIKVKAINHRVYKLVIRSYEAAGILPYSVHPITGEAVFLLGRLTYGGGTWCDFGGLKTKFKVIKYVVMVTSHTHITTEEV